jgi:hypothetical protein
MKAIAIAAVQRNTKRSLPAVIGLSKGLLINRELYWFEIARKKPNP